MKNKFFTRQICACAQIRGHWQEFFETGQCIGCGKCSMTCPLNIIDIVNYKPSGGLHVRIAWHVYISAPKERLNSGKYPQEKTVRTCRKISDADCAGYFFEVKLLKQLSKNVGVAGCGEAFCRFHMHLHMKSIIGEIDKSRCVSYFSTVPYYIRVNRNGRTGNWCKTAEEKRYNL